MADFAQLLMTVVAGIEGLDHARQEKFGAAQVSDEFIVEGGLHGMDRFDPTLANPDPQAILDQMLPLYPPLRRAHVGRDQDRQVQIDVDDVDGVPSGKPRLLFRGKSRRRLTG